MVVGGHFFASRGVYFSTMTAANHQQLQGSINVTPLIDVLLVLLITFMLITPLTPKGIDALAPEQAPAFQQPRDPVVLQIARDGTLRLNGRIVARTELPSVLRAAYADRQEKTLFVDAPKDLEYRAIMTVIDEVRGSDPGIRFAVLK